jgi:hypothetical protein
MGGKDLTMRVYSDTKDSDRESVQLMLGVTLPHVIQSFAAFTLCSKLYVLQEPCGESLNDHMELGTTFSSQTLLRQLSGLAEDIEDLNDGRHSKGGLFSRRATIRLTPGRIHVFPDRRSILCLSIDPSDLKKKLRWAFDCGEYTAPEELQSPPYEKHTENSSKHDWSVGSTWSVGCTYLEILVWHVMGYEAVADFRSRRSQGHSMPYFFHPANPVTNDEARRHEVVIEMFDNLLEQSEGYVREAVLYVDTMLQIDPKERPTAFRFRSEFARLAAEEEEKEEEREEKEEEREEKEEEREGKERGAEERKGKGKDKDD